jgi:hypothetical protein
MSAPLELARHAVAATLNEYAETARQWLEQGVSPQEVCNRLILCMAAQATAMDRELEQKKEGVCP